MPIGLVPPCVPTNASRPPMGDAWLHEIKHDGFRLMARHDGAGVRLLTRNGHDWPRRFPLIAQAVSALRARSCLVDGEAVACNDGGPAVFERLRGRRHDASVFLYAFDLIEAAPGPQGDARVGAGQGRTRPPSTSISRLTDQSPTPAR